jgi:hypothetical protein
MLILLLCHTVAGLQCQRAVTGKLTVALAHPELKGMIQLADDGQRGRSIVQYPALKTESISEIISYKSGCLEFEYLRARHFTSTSAMSLNSLSRIFAQTGNKAVRKEQLCASRIMAWKTYSGLRIWRSGEFDLFEHEHWQWSAWYRRSKGTLKIAF